MRKLRQLGALLLVLVCIAWVVLTARWLRYDAESFRKMVFGLLPELSFEAGAAHRGCRLPAFVPPEAFVVGQYSNYSQHFAQQQTVTSAFPVEHSDALELLQPLVMAASLRNGYRYAFGTSKHHGASIPAQLVREDRMLCRRANGDWGIMLSGAKQLVSANVDANAAAVLGVPLVNAHEISAAGLGAVRTALQRAGAEHLAAGALAGVMGTPTRVAMWTDPWAPKEASNDEWGRVLTGVPWGCAGLPSEDPSCLRAYLQAAQDAVKNIVTASLRGSTHGAAPVGGGAQWGANHAGTVYGWDAGGACAACLLQHAASGVFFMWQPSWIRVPSLRGRPVGLLSHWACRWHRGNEDSLQCGLPVETPGEGKSGGDVVSCNGLECVEVLNRTAFIQDSLMGFHHTHKIFHYFTAAVGIMHDLSSAPERDLLSTSVGEAEYVDTSPVALQPQFSRAGVLRMDWPKTARLTCVRSSVVGVAGLCPNGYCETALLAAGRDIMAAHVRRRLGVPPPAPLAHRKQHNVVLLQRAAGTRSFINPSQLLDILQAFQGVQVRELALEGTDFKQQVEAFGNISLLVATHGNAMGNMLWMPHGAAVMEALGDGFETSFFSSASTNLGIPWSKQYCNTDMRQQPLDAAFLEAQLALLRADPRVSWMVGPDTAQALLEVQRRTDAGQYTIPAAVKLARNSALVPQWDVIGPNQSCIVESTMRDGGDQDPKHRHVYLPPAQFLGAFVQLVLQWREGLQTP